MNRVDARPARHPEHVVQIEVGIDRRAALADEIALVGGEAMPRAAIFLGEDRYRAHLELARGAHDADGDLAAVGDEEASNLLVQNRFSHIRDLQARVGAARRALRPARPAS